MASCAVDGGCASDYIAIAISAVCFILLLSRLILPFAIHKIPLAKRSSFWIPVIQIFASFNLLLSVVVDYRFICSIVNQ